MSEGESGLGRPFPSPGSWLRAQAGLVSFAYICIYASFTCAPWQGPENTCAGTPEGIQMAGCLLEYPNRESWSMVHPPVKCLNLRPGAPLVAQARNFRVILASTLFRYSHQAQQSLSLSHPSHASPPFHCLCHQPAGPSLFTSHLTYLQQSPNWVLCHQKASRLPSWSSPLPKVPILRSWLVFEALDSVETPDFQSQLFPHFLIFQPSAYIPCTHLFCASVSSSVKGG